MIALLAMFLTASLTFATGSIQATAQENPQELDCWSDESKMLNGEDPDVSSALCSGINNICCYHESGIYEFTPL